MTISAEPGKTAGNCFRVSGLATRAPLARL